MPTDFPAWAKGVHGAFEPAAVEALRLAREMNTTISILVTVIDGTARFETITSAGFIRIKELRTKAAQEHLAPIAAAIPKGVLELYPPLRGLMMSPHLTEAVAAAAKAAEKAVSIPTTSEEEHHV